MRTLVLFSFAAFSCLAQTPPSTPKPVAPKPVAPKPVAPKPLAPKPTPTPKPEETREPGLYGTMETTMGTLKFVLYEKIAPISVKNFCDLVLGRKPWFDEKTNGMVRRPLIPGTTFHRVIPGFMIQTGDPTGTGSGNVGFTVPDEFNPDYKFDKPGRFGMANVGRPNTNSSQFFITEAPTPWLDGKHTVFGQLTDNQELVNKIARVPVGENNKPVTPVKIVKVTFERVGPVPPNAPEGAPPAKKYVPPVKKAAPTTTPVTAPTKKAAAPPAVAPTKK